eukprot:5152943-Amphidinium_carterae.1
MIPLKAFVYIAVRSMRRLTQPLQHTAWQSAHHFQVSVRPLNHSQSHEQAASTGEIWQLLLESHASRPGSCDSRRVV